MTYPCKTTLEPVDGTMYDSVGHRDPIMSVPTSPVQHRQIRRVVGFLLAACIVAGTLYWPQISDVLDRTLVRRHQATFEGIDVRGSERFVGQVTKALVLLRDKSPDTFAVVGQFVKRIREHSRSGMRAYDDPPTFDLAPRSAYHSLTWCSGAIAHDAYHSKLYHDYRSAHGKPVPYDAWCGQARELECNQFQAVALEEIGAPRNEIDYLRGLDGSHFDDNGNW
jgi:hypothetical protein